ncbi:type I polyketide synthase [Thermomonospora umbrina]|uniref:Polyketide-type polyunsaturated fatty acid synthase PfaA n=1 Tax=Thermomonospora umbrina TaxID=111806 RepID=A0A3D9SLE4_9ACTN|nr:type I polyketide synthase [Thermomonospora umbrina]REE95220.1 polyketide-type polyunsaturated fatty acid synthase PfaA [Thermomonospora umbrina]
MPGTARRQCPIAIVGLDAVMPGALDVADFWRNVVTGRDLITDVPATHWRVEDYHDPDPTAPDRTYCRRGAFLPEVEFDPTAFGILPKALSATDTSQLLSLFVAGRLLSRMTERGVGAGAGERVGVILGCTALELLGVMAMRMGRPLWLNGLRRQGIPEQEAQQICDRIVDDGFLPWQESTFPGLLSNVVAGRIAKTFDLHGTNCTLDAACASSLAALSMAIAELELHRCDVVLTGGVDTLNDPVTYLCFSKTPALSFTGDCRPFAEGADGTMLGEGLAMFALKRLDDAERDGDPIHAVIRGIGSSSDGQSTAIYLPQESGQARALRGAYELAGYGPETVELVEAHGTGTVAGDLTEMAALRKVFDESGRGDRQWCAVGSVKSQIGHTKAAAGAAGLLKAVLALQHGVLPPTIKVERPEPALDLETSPFYLNTVARPWVHPTGDPRRASVSSFGFGGTNFHLTLEEYVGDRKAPRRRVLPSELVLLSADSPGELRARCATIDTGGGPAAVARRSQGEFQKDAGARLAVVAESDADLAEKLARAGDLIERSPDGEFSFPGLHYRPGPASQGRVAFLFPGQGAQYVGMSADLAMAYPTALAVWDEIARHEVGDVVRDAVFPIPAFGDFERTTQERWLTATEQAQPAMAAHSLVLLALLRDLGIRPDCTAGHSFGELVALHAAGVLTAPDLLRVARHRGQSMNEAVTVPTGMVAVAADADTVQAALAACGGEDLWVTGYNAPAQTIVSGTRKAIDALRDELAGRGLGARPLDTSLAFHSPLLRDAIEPFSKFLQDIEVASPDRPVYGNANAEPYPAEPDEIRHMIAAHVAAPVRFGEEIEAMYAAGVRTFVEVGAGTVLTGLVRQVLGDRDHCAVSLDRRGTDGVTGLNNGLGLLAVQGITGDYERLWDGYPPQPEDTASTTSEVSRLAVRISGTNYGKPYPFDEQDVREAPPRPAAAAIPATSDEMLQRTTEVHLAYQRMLSESHQKFLELAERSFAGTPEGAPPPMPALPPQPAVPPHPVEPPAESRVEGTAPPSEATDLRPDNVRTFVLSVIEDKTGYPTDMLKDELELDRDLGIDSIKRVEILSSLEGIVPSLNDIDKALLDDLAALRTIGDVIAKAEELLAGTPRPAPRDETPPHAEEVTPVHRQVPRAVPSPCTGLGMAGLGEGRIAVTDDLGGVAPLLVTELAARGIEAEVVDTVPDDAGGVVLLDGLRDVRSIDEALEVQRSCFRTARALATRMAEQGGIFVTVQNGGGDFGLTGSTPSVAWLAGLSALARTAAAEWPAAGVKAIDCALPDASEAAAAIARELAEGGPALNVGLRADGTRVTLRYEQTVPDDQVSEGVPAALGDAPVIVASGGARGITAVALRALSAASRPRLVLLGRTELNDEPSGLADAEDEAAVVGALARRATAGADPLEIRATARDVLAVREIKASMAAFAAAGAEARYLCVDVRDDTAVATALERVRREWGPITGFVHGAGVLADGLLSAKEDAQFDRVFDTKLEGLRSLLAATERDPLRLLCAFSSVSAHLGTPGQCDYAMANETLEHVLVAEGARRPDCLVRAIAWGPWSGGMVSEALAARFRSAGYGLIPYEAGGDAFLAELSEPTGVRVIRSAPPLLRPPRTAARLKIDEAGHLHLADHTIADVPVVPAAVVLEWFLAAADDARPGEGRPLLRDFKVYRGLKLPRFADGGHRLTVCAGDIGSEPPSRGGLELRLSDDTGRPCYRAIVPGSTSPEEATNGHWTPPQDLISLGSAGELYSTGVLFHGPAFQALESVDGVSAGGARATVIGTRGLGWASGRHWRSDPGAVDGALQLAGLWAGHALGAATLPMGVRECRVRRGGLIDEPATCLVLAGETAAAHAECDVVLLDADGTARIELRGVHLVRRPS